MFKRMKLKLSRGSCGWRKEKTWKDHIFIKTTLANTLYVLFPMENHWTQRETGNESAILPSLVLTKSALALEDFCILPCHVHAEWLETEEVSFQLKVFTCKCFSSGSWKPGVMIWGGSKLYYGHWCSSATMPCPFPKILAIYLSDLRPPESHIILEP